MLLEMKFRSKEIKKETQVNVFLPDRTTAREEGEPCRVLWLLHGLSGTYNDWVTRSSILRYAKENDLAVIMPDGDRSWYTDTAYGANYFSYITKELPQLCYNTFKELSPEREYNLIGGLSMGGYGAMKAALTCPQQYAACISLSGSLDITRKNRACDLPLWKAIFGYDLESPLELEGSAHDLFALAKSNREKGLPFPKLYLWCGLEDSLLNVNRSFHQILTDLDVEHKYEESTGDHSWKWWDLHIQPGIRYVLNKE